MKSKAKSKKKSNLRILKDMFLELLPVLHNQGFVESPFVNSSPGWHPWLGYIYMILRDWMNRSWSYLVLSYQ